MKTPTAVLIGFLMVSLAITFGPELRRFVIPPAYAQLDANDFQMINRGLTQIASAISAACRR